jgi:hypothetical protein
MRLITRFRNLSAIPSYHHHPVFGREVVRAIKALKPAAIALGISDIWATEFEWGVSQWPSPVVSYANNRFLPMVPEDSMVEACRLAKDFGIPLFFVDFALANVIKRPSRGLLPDAVLAPRVGNLFLEANDALQAFAGPPATGDVAREAHMALRLAELMEQFDSVLWVGGMAHWSRIRSRLAARAYKGPRLREADHPDSFKRMRLECSALYGMTQRLPCQLIGYSRAPTGYDEARNLRRLALAAVKPEKHEAVDIASMLVYARNIEAPEHLSESPGPWQLLTAASLCLGNEYALRLAILALTDRFHREAKFLPLLTRRLVKHRNGKYLDVYRCEGKILAGQSLFGSPVWIFSDRRLPSSVEIKRRQRNTSAAEVKLALPNTETAWAGYPDDDMAYEAFVRYVLEHLSAIHRMI